MPSKSLKVNAVFNAGKTVSTIIFPLITFPYISRVLLPDNIGKVNFGLSIISYFSLIATLGMSSYAIRECAKSKKTKEELSRTASQLFSISICTTLVAYILLAFTLVFFRKFDSYRSLIIILSTTILFTTLGADWINSAMEDFKYITIRTISFQLISIVLMFLFVKKTDDYYKYAAIIVLSSSGANITNLWYRRRFCSTRFTIHMNIRQHLGPIFAFFAMVFSVTIFANADVTMLGLMSGDYQVGLYSTAHKILHVVSQLVQSLIYVLMPRLSVFFATQDFDNANRLLRKLLGFNISLGLPCVVGLIMVATDAILVFAGPEYVGSASVLRIMVLSFAFSLVGGSFLGNGILLPIGREKYYMTVCLVTAVCNIILNYLFIPFFQANAAAATTAFNGFLIFILLLFNIDKRIRIERIGRIFVGPFVGCLAIVGICVICRNIPSLFVRLILSIGLSGIAYSGVLFLTRNETMLEIFSLIKNFQKRV